ncbi:MAG TPA: hypothetical protein VMV94_06085, partial [Phycisphaerae bacterium]|nr:hypothetical protein [Phycisphaerae bacterium]
MAKKSASFIDLHAEKVVLGVCAAALVAAGVYSFGGFRFKVGDRGPAELVEEAGRQADQVAQAVARAQLPPAPPADPNKPDNPAQQVEKWFTEGPRALADFWKIQPKLWRTQKYPPVRPEITGVSLEDRRELVKAVAPSVPVVVSDRKSLDLPAEAVDYKPDRSQREPGAAGGKSVVRSYISVGAEIDLSEMERRFKAAKYPVKSKLPVVMVRLQRKDTSEPWRGWQDVDAWLPVKPPPKPLDANNEILVDRVAEYKKLIEDAKKILTRPNLPGRGVSDLPLPSLDESPRDSNNPTSQADRRIKKFTDVAKKAMAGKKPFTQVDLDVAYMNALAAVAETNGSEKEVDGAKKVLEEIEGKLPKARRAEWRTTPLTIDHLMPLVAHDVDVVPGHAYEYRLRYELLNPSAGDPGDMKNPDDAKVLTVLSDWSPASRPVEVSSDLLFFLTQADPKKKDVTVTVYRKTHTGWKEQEYKVKVGETIGTKEKAGKN